MKASSKSRYGIRALVDLGLNAREEQIALAEIAERQKISIQYLEQVFSTLRKAGLVKSIKGAGGGYLLGKDPKEMTLLEVINVLDGNISILATLEDDLLTKDDFIEETIRLNLWEPIDKMTLQFLESITINDLILASKEKQTSACNMYFI